MEEHVRITIQTYDQIAQNYVNMTSDIRPQLEFERFCDLVQSNGRILDAGCAWGRDCRAFYEKGFSVVGIELSIEMLKLAKKHATSCHFLQTDVRKIPMANECAHGIWCCATLLHLKRTDITTALKEFRRVLKPGALCYMQVKKGIGEEIVGERFSQGNLRFFSYFHEEEVRDYCIQSGYSIVDEHTFNEKDRFGPGSRDQEQLCFLIRKNVQVP